ncbi:uncharacterized protein LOC143606911 [Bidens hawaiensis]|uniref:uncharacterized protein LOC143606911 n=1 Tax=Bidens hawaiensis TaxID=980011 RepID=UPI00404907AF
MNAITQHQQFHGREDEDAPTHINRLTRVFKTFNLQGANEDAIFLHLFPFTLSDRAATWLDSQPAGAFTTWEALRNAFIKKYFPPAKASRLRDQIHSFHMEPDEPYYQAWKRFQNLLSHCSQHGLTPWALVKKFYNGLTYEAQVRFDTAAGGNLMDRKNVIECNELFESFAQFEYAKKPRSGNSNPITSTPSSARDVHQMLILWLVRTSSLMLTTTTIRTGTTTSVRIRIRTKGKATQIGARPGGPLGFQAPYNRNQGQYNSGSSNEQSSGNGKDSSGSMGRLEEMMQQILNRDQVTQKTLADHDLLLKNQQSAMLDMQRTIGDISQQLNERPWGQFSGSTQQNPTAQIKAITTRSGRVLSPNVRRNEVEVEDEEVMDEEIEMEVPGKVQNTAPVTPPVVKKSVEVRPSPLLKINLPFIEALQHMPKYAKFLKDLLKRKDRLGEVSSIPIMGDFSAVVLNRVPEKLSDSGMLTIPCFFGSNAMRHALADLGAT